MPGFLVAILPPGAFISTGLLIALKNSIDKEIKTRQEAKRGEVVAGSFKRIDQCLT